MALIFADSKVDRGGPQRPTGKAIGVEGPGNGT